MPLEKNGKWSYLIKQAYKESPSSRGLGHRVFIPATRVRIPLEMPFFVFGRLAQLVRALLSHGRGHRFEFCYAHHLQMLKSSVKYD